MPAAESSSNWYEAPLVGRDHELAELLGLLDSVKQRSSGSLVVVVGAAGSGKTRLCRELTDRLDGPAVSKAWALTDPLDSGPALGPWQYAAERLWGDIEIESAPTIDTRDRWSLFRAMLGRFETACTEPTVVILDDLHRADTDTLTFTNYVVPALRQIPLLVVATWRAAPGEPAGPQLDSLTSAGRRIDLHPLADAAVADLLRASRHATLSIDDVALVAELARGNPFAALETAQSLTSNRRAGQADGSWLPTVPLDQLGAEARSVVDAVAVIHRRCSPALVAEVAETDVDTVVGSLAAARGILDDDDEGIGFVHDLLAEATRSAIAPNHRAALHLRAAAAVSSHLNDEVAEAEHRAAANRLGHGEASELLDAAAAAAETLWRNLAWARSLKWYELAAETARRIEAPDRWEHMLAEAAAKQRCGFMTEARGLFQSVLIEVPVDRVTTRVDAALGAAGIWVEEQRDPLERRRLVDECQELADGLPSGEATRIAELRVRLAAEEHYDTAGRDLAPLESSIADVRGCNDDAALARALSIQHHCLLGPDHEYKRLEVANELMAAARRSGMEFHATLGLCWLVVDQYLQGDPIAETSYAHLRRRVDLLGVESLRYVADVIDVMRTMRSGHLDEAEAAAAVAQERGAAAGDADALGYYVGQIGAIRWMQGRLAELEPAVRDVIASGTLRKQDVVYPALLSVTAALRGEHREASGIAHQMVDDGVLHTRMMSTWLTTMTILGQAAYLLDDRTLADRIQAAISPYAHLPVMPSLAVACLGPLARTLGLTSIVRGEIDQACRYLEEAQQICRRLRNVPMGAHIDMDLATALSRQPDSASRARAKQLAGEAIQQATDLGLDDLVTLWTASELDVGDGPNTFGVGRVASSDARRGELARLKHGWRMTMDDRVLTLPKHNGFEYLAVLLGNPDHEFGFGELANLAGTKGGAAPAAAGYEPVLDDRARRELANRLLQIQSDLALLDPKRDAEQWQALIDEEQAIESELLDSKTPRGSQRPLDKEASKLADRVKKAIGRALAEIAKMDDAIGQELNATIERRSVACYRPLRVLPISWTIERRGDGYS